jgi:hypothetical protein
MTRVWLDVEPELAHKLTLTASYFGFDVDKMLGNIVEAIKDEYPVLGQIIAKSGYADAKHPDTFQPAEVVFG